MLMKHRLLAIALPGLLTMTAHAAESRVTECAEVNFLMGRGTGDFSKYDTLGASVAGGFRRGGHLLQLEVGGLRGESYEDDLAGRLPDKPTVLAFDDARSQVDQIPVWANYRYGVSFGPSDRFRIEAGPTAGLAIERITTKGNVTTFDTSTGTTTRNGSYRESSGGVIFQYGAGITLSCRIDKHWSARVGLRHIESTRLEVEQDTPPLSNGTDRYYHRVVLPAHGENIVAIGAEYTF